MSGYHDPYNNIPNRTGKQTGNMYNGGDNSGVFQMVCMLLFAAVLLGLVIATLVCVVDLKSTVMELDSEIYCPLGASCVDGSLLGGSGTCDANHVCQGMSKGQCDSGPMAVELEPADCRNLTWSYTVDAFDLFQEQICWHDKCVWFLGPEFPIVWACEGDDSGRYETKERAENPCLDFLDGDVDRPFFDVTLTCVMDAPLCVYSYQRAKYLTVTPTVAPVALSLNGETIIDPAHKDMPVRAAQMLEDKGIIKYFGERNAEFQARKRSGIAP